MVVMLDYYLSREQVEFVGCFARLGTPSKKDGLPTFLYHGQRPRLGREGVLRISQAIFVVFYRPMIGAQMTSTKMSITPSLPLQKSHPRQCWNLCMPNGWTMSDR